MKAQNHPELEWFSFESEHFIYHYHSGTERTAQMALTIAEEVYPKVSALYDWEPADKTHIVIQDTDDYTNGGAYYFDNKILLWASPLQFDLRGNSNWIRNVFTHEFSHIISLGKSMKFPISTPAAFVQVLDREKPFRDNIIMEYPRGIASVPIANVVVPMWWAEGVAQYQYKDAPHDLFDSHRDMLIRDRALNGKLLDWMDASHFGKMGTGNESVYNTGLAFVEYLSDKYGPEIQRKIALEASKKSVWSFNTAFKNIFGEDGRTMYAEWQNNLRADYQNDTQTIRDHLHAGEFVFMDAPSYLYTEISPDGDHIVVASSRKRDYIGLTSLYEYKDGKLEKISDRTRGNMAFSPNGKKLYYAKRQQETLSNSVWFDLMEYNFETQKETRLTYNARIYSVAVTPDSQIYVVRVNDGSHNIFQFVEDDSMRAVTHFTDGEQVYTLRAHPNGKELIFDMALMHGRDIYSLNLENQSIQPLIQSKFDNRHPVFADNGKSIIYSSDRTGIFNLYRYDLNTEKDELITNLTGAAFYPAWNEAEQSVWFTNFNDGKFNWSKLENPTAIDYSLAKYRECIVPQEDIDPGDMEEFVSIPYESQYSRFFVMPYMMWDYGTVKAGAVVYQNEILDKFNLIASAGINPRQDIDLYTHLDYNGLLPGLFWENYFMTYHLDAQTGKIYEYYPEENTYSFSLWETVGGLKYRWQNQYWEFTGAYGEYSAHIETRQELAGQVQQFTYGYTYFKGGRAQLRYAGDFVGIGWHSGIHPQMGFDYDIKLAYDFNRFITDFGINSDFGTLQEIYENDNTARVELAAGYYIPFRKLGESALSFQVNAGWLENTEVDSFFNFFGGGMPGLKGYPYYTIEGTNKAIFTTTWRIPIARQMNLSLEPFALDRIYFAVYHQMGDVWRGSLWDSEFYGDDASIGKALKNGVLNANWKQDIGFQLRIGGYSFYAYPLAITLEAVYGMDEFTVYDQNIGGSWRFYWTVLFEFQRRQWWRD